MDKNVKRDVVSPPPIKMLVTALYTGVVMRILSLKYYYLGGQF